MYSKRGVGVGVGSRTEMSRVSHNEDLKRIKEALDKRDRSSPSTSRPKDNNNNNITSKDQQQQQQRLSILSAPSTNRQLPTAAEMLYGLIHVQYILTTKGQAAMLEKYKNAEFGRCPRVYCCGQPCLPVGQSDIPRHCTVKIYCPKCEDIYTPRSRFQDNLDGAYFGTTFPHLFLMTYGHLKPQKTSQTYVPRVFGFKVHKP